MGLTTLHEITSSEKSARRYLLGFCWKNHQRYCPRCKERKSYRIADGKRRCARCAYTFHDFSQRFAAGCWSSAQQWLWFLKLFELEVAPKDMAVQLKCSYATVLKAQDITRRAILAQALDAHLLYSYGVWPGPRRPKTRFEKENSPIFGLVEVNDYAICDVLPDITPDDLLRFKLNFRLKTSSVGHVVYTAPYQDYRTLIGCGPGLWPARWLSHEDRSIPADGGGFWPYAKTRIRRMRGVLPAHFPLYLKEWELRYNNRGKDLFPVLASAICTLVPDPDRSLEASAIPEADEEAERPAPTPADASA